MEVEEDLSEKGGLVISDVSEFVSNLASSAVQVAPARPTQTKEDTPEPESIPSPAIAQKAHEDTVMKDTKAESEEDSFRSRTRAESEEAEDITMKESNESEHVEPVRVYHFMRIVVFSGVSVGIFLCSVRSTNAVPYLHLNLFL
jgi:U4/U6.U5 tri-snRNP-associated protein 1